MKQGGAGRYRARDEGSEGKCFPHLQGFMHVKYRFLGLFAAFYNTHVMPEQIRQYAPVHYEKDTAK